jgi:hypothetical protein
MRPEATLKKGVKENSLFLSLLFSKPHVPKTAQSEHVYNFTSL